MKIDGNTKLKALLDEYPFLKEFLIKYNENYKDLNSPQMVNIMGRIATLKMIARNGNVELEKLINDITTEINNKLKSSDGVSDKKIEALKNIILQLHEDGNKEEAKKKFDEMFSGVNGLEIANMEQQLIRDGMKFEKIQNLCDIHTGTFKSALDKNDVVETPPGHPINTYMEENIIIQTLLDEISETLKKLKYEPSPTNSNIEIKRMKITMEKLWGINNHYVRKENQIFPYLEKNEIEGPPKVMWGVHDDIRTIYKVVKKSIDRFDVKTFKEQAPELVRLIGEMIYKENKILFPMCMETFDETDWLEIRKGEDELGYSFVEPSSDWLVDSISSEKSDLNIDGFINLEVGTMSIEQINLIMEFLPVDFSFIDENDIVKYYSGGERTFPRTPAVIGRKVMNCHPPKSAHIVESILSQFKAGKKNVAEFWFTLNNKFLHIRYFAVRDKIGNYKGCLEVGQDITEIKNISGEQRLLSWK